MPYRLRSEKLSGGVVSAVAGSGLSLNTTGIGGGVRSAEQLEVRTATHDKKLLGDFPFSFDDRKHRRSGGARALRLYSGPLGQQGFLVSLPGRRSTAVGPR